MSQRSKRTRKKLTSHIELLLAATRYIHGQRCAKEGGCRAEASQFVEGGIGIEQSGARHVKLRTNACGLPLPPFKTRTSRAMKKRRFFRSVIG
jgi:hypothetical protein